MTGIPTPSYGLCTVRQFILLFFVLDLAFVFSTDVPAAYCASRSALCRSRLFENAFCAISCSVIAFSASTWRIALRASRSTLVIGFGGSTSPGIFITSSPFNLLLFWLPISFVSGHADVGTLLTFEQATLSAGLIVGMSSNFGQAVDIVNIESESRSLIFPSSSVLVVRP
jgi:hypothetical protein